MDRRDLCRLFAAALLAGACASSPREPAEGPESAPPYSPEAARLFDDMLSPQLFGFDPQARDPAKDPLLLERIVRADFILPAKVETVSRVGGIHSQGAYELALRATGPVLAGHAPPDPLTVEVRAGGAAYSWVASAGATWVGTRLILFGRRFRDGEGLVVHFRAESDTPTLRAAIDRHVALRVLRQ